jgi:4-diphosphocytidyl-2-C-methyl-D-erythritol kinase
MSDQTLTDFAPAKVNLTLRVRGRRADGYHELESLVAFAEAADRLSFTPGEELALAVEGPTAAAAGADASNLVVRAAHALASRVPGLRTGRFVLDKRLPVAAGLGGGSSDAAAALRLLARANALGLDDARLMDAAREVGADVPVCLDPRARVMRGIGERLSPPLDFEPLPAVLVNPGVAVATGEVFRALNAPPLPADVETLDRSPEHRSFPRKRESRGDEPDGSWIPAFAGTRGVDGGDVQPDYASARWRFIESGVNDLQPPAVALQPAIAEVLAALSASRGCRLARMSGSGATCFALYATDGEAAAAASVLQAAHPAWWVVATTLG